MSPVADESTHATSTAAATDGAPRRILLAKTALDGHWRGISVVARALRDGGFQVILGGMSTGTEIVRAAIDEDVDLVGLNVGGHVAVAERIIGELRAARPDLPVFAGGIIAPWAAKRLQGAGRRSVSARLAARRDRRLRAPADWRRGRLSG